jgi:hypothetical protein
MATHKLDLGDFDEVDYYIIAIHTSLEDYRLAYFINQQLPINLSKSKDEVQITIKEGETKFARFYYYDNENAVSWNLMVFKIYFRVYQWKSQRKCICFPNLKKQTIF